MSELRIAGAPVSFGVFELTPEGAEVIDPDRLLGIYAQAGYDGIDLGPLGYLGIGAALRQRLELTGLALAGGWVQLPFGDDREFEGALPELDAALAAFAASGAAGVGALPTLADCGTELRRRNPGRGEAVDPVDSQTWNSLTRNVAIAADRVRAAGFEPTFHHHAGTRIEAVDEIDALLAAVEIGLTLDTGHLSIAGGDSVEALRQWAGRINHVHLKDVSAALLGEVLRSGGGMREVWASGAFTALGAGDLDLDGVFAQLEAASYGGWLVVEQDVLLGAEQDLDDFVVARSVDQAHNLAFVKERLG